MSTPHLAFSRWMLLKHSRKFTGMIDDATELVAVGEADWKANNDVPPNHVPFPPLPAVRGGREGRE